MNDNQAADHAWSQCKGELEPQKWSIGEHATFYGFFLNGWHARAAWDAHKASECQRLADELGRLRSENERLRAMVEWQPPETAPMDGTEILIKTRQGIVSAWFADEPPTNDALDNGVYDWICFDDEFTLDGHGEHVLGWMPLPNA